MNSLIYNLYKILYFAKIIGSLILNLRIFDVEYLQSLWETNKRDDALSPNTDLDHVRLT